MVKLIVFQLLYSAYFNGGMACSELTLTAQEAALFAVSLAFFGRFEHNVLLLILIFIVCQFVQDI